ncbi:STAS domain-containing protein [Streptomyces sp. NPDC048182]|uniref:STAS domain-containing protein n=1 Tax=unclassified Streptomyces TaxID=2593676 RepID=UPI0033B39566
MTTIPEHTFQVTAAGAAAGEVRLRLAGDLDYDSAQDLLESARGRLGARPAPSALRLDCAGLTLCDSMGLATLLMVHRLATEAGAVLRLEECPGFLARLLELTGTLDHFMHTPPAAAPAPDQGAVPRTRPSQRDST